MLMAITEIEQRIFVEKINQLSKMDLEEWASDSFSDREFRLIFIKAINNLLENVQKNGRGFSESLILDDSEAAKNALEELMLNLVRAASFSKDQVAAQKPKTIRFEKQKKILGYTTGQLANYFGVSITTINNWINEGRFLKELENGELNQLTRKSPHEKIKIEPNTWFDAPAGVRYQVKEVVEAYEIDQEEWNHTKQENTVSEAEQINLYLNHFKEKYGGRDFQTVFGDKDWDHLSAEEETDASMWSFFLQRIKSGKDSRN